ncbi:MAG TPA: hypothetical protein VG408_00140 [Actinomycetota bacterium]|nr:hypothetical protein [Actinomycetota bacterium]
MIIGLLSLASCTSGPQGPVSQPTTEGVAKTGLEADYEFEAFPGSRWYGPNGDEIPVEGNIINAITGPEHCDWQSAVMMHMGWPPGHDAADISESRQYLRDPEGIFEKDMLMTSFDANVELPERAEYTGYRTDFMELWFDQEDDDAAYLVFANHVERWPRAEEPIACA